MVNVGYALTNVNVNISMGPLSTDMFLIFFFAFLVCEDGTYGYDCNNNCSGNCLGDSPCNKQTGHCKGGCRPGYTTALCNKRKLYWLNEKDSPFLSLFLSLIIITVMSLVSCIVLIFMSI